MTPNDSCLSNELITAVHLEVRRRGLQQSVNFLGEREPALTAFLLLGADEVFTFAKRHGINEFHANQLQRHVLHRMIVAVDSVFRGHYELWRDMMGDETTANESEGGNHG